MTNQVSLLLKKANEHAFDAADCLKQALTAYQSINRPEGITPEDKIIRQHLGTLLLAARQLHDSLSMIAD